MDMSTAIADNILSYFCEIQNKYTYVFIRPNVNGQYYQYYKFVNIKTFFKKKFNIFYDN